MRSYVKVVQISDGRIFSAKLATIFGISGEVMRLQYFKVNSATAGYNLLRSTPYWIGFNQAPQNLSFGSITGDPMDTEPARHADGTSIVQQIGGAGLAANCFDLERYDTHPLN